MPGPWASGYRCSPSATGPFIRMGRAEVKRGAGVDLEPLAGF